MTFRPSRLTGLLLKVRFLSNLSVATYDFRMRAEPQWPKYNSWYRRRYKTDQLEQSRANYDWVIGL